MKMTWPPRKYRRFMISHPFFFFHVMSPKLPSLHQAFGLRESGLGLMRISQFLLIVRLTCFILLFWLGKHPWPKAWVLTSQVDDEGLFETKTVKSFLLRARM
jgi:hypothetical protein